MADDIFSAEQRVYNFEKHRLTVRAAAVEHQCLFLFQNRIARLYKEVADVFGQHLSGGFIRLYFGQVFFEERSRRIWIVFERELMRQKIIFAEFPQFPLTVSNLIRSVQ